MCIINMNKIHILSGYKKANITFYVSCTSIHLTYFSKYYILILFPCIRISIHCSMHQKSSRLCICCNIIRHFLTCCVVYYFKEYFMNQARISCKTSQFNQLYYQCWLINGRQSAHFELKVLKTMSANPFQINKKRCVANGICSILWLIYINIQDITCQV